MLILPPPLQLDGAFLPSTNADTPLSKFAPSATSICTGGVIYF